MVATTITNETTLDTALAGGTPGTFSNSVVETAAPTALLVGAGAVTLDGADHTLTSDGTDAALIVTSDTLTVESLFVDGAITNNDAIVFAADGTYTTNAGSINGIISGSGTIEVTSGTLVLNDANTYQGTTTIDNGASILLGTNGSIADSSAVVVNGTLDLYEPKTSSDTGTTIDINDLSGAATGVIQLGGNSLQVSGTSAAYDGLIEGAGALVVYGTGLTLEGAIDTANSGYTGATKIYGALTLDDSGNTFTSSNFSLKASGASLTIEASATITELTGVAGTSVAIDAGETLTVSEDVAASFSGVISGATGGLVVDGAAILTLAGDSTYGGTTSVYGDLSLTGTLDDTDITVEADGVFSVTGNSGDGPVVIDGSGVLDVVTGGVIVDAASVNDGGTLDISGATGPVGVTDLTGAGKVHLGSGTVILYSSSPETFSGVISSTGAGAVQIGAGSSSSSQAAASAAAEGFYEFSGVNTYTGATKIYGELTLATSGSIADSSNVSLKASGAEFILSETTAIYTATTDPSLTSQVYDINELTGVTGSLVELGATGDTAITSGPNSGDYTDVVGSSLVITEDAEAATFSGTFVGSGGTVTIAAATTGTTYELTLAGNSTSFDDAVVIATGASLALSGSGSIADAISVTLHGTLDVSGVTSGATTLNDLSDSSAHPGSLVLGSTTVTLDDGADETFNGVISGQGNITVDDDGFNLTLAGANTYTGTTTIASTDTLILTGSLASASIVDNGTLDLELGSTGATTLSGVISGTTGALDILSGTVTLTGASTFSGTTTISSGATLALSGSGSLADSAVSDGGTLAISGSNAGVSIDGLTGNGTVLLGSNTLTLTLSDTFDGEIEGTGSLFIGTASETSVTHVILTDASTYSGGTRVYGELELDGGSIADASVSLKSVTVGSSTTYAELLVDSSTDIGSLSGVVSTTVSLVAGTSATSLDTLTVTQDAAATFSGTFTGGAHTELVLDGSAALTLATTNAISSNIEVVVDGILTLGAGQTVTELSGTGTINLGANSLVDVISSETAQAFSGVISGTGALQVDGVVSYASELSANAFLPGTTSLLTLSNASNTFSGGLLIEGGGVEVAASGAAGTGTITFQDANSETGMLRIENAALTSTGSDSYSFSNHIAGVSEYDVIDLPGLAYDGTTTTTLTGTTLVISEDGVSVTLNITGASGVTGFTALEDSHGGTYIISTADYVAASHTYDTGHYHP